jgi:hypothetical protein
MLVVTIFGLSRCAIDNCVNQFRIIDSVQVLDQRFRATQLFAIHTVYILIVLVSQRRQFDPVSFALQKTSPTNRL